MRERWRILMLRAPHRLRIGRLSRGEELGRTETWLGDKLKVEGDMGLLMRLEGLISKAWGEKWQPLATLGKS